MNNSDVYAYLQNDSTGKYAVRYGTNFATGAMETTGLTYCDSLYKIIVKTPFAAIPGQTMFIHNSNLVSVELPSSLTYLGYGCFAYCTALPEIVLPDNMQNISEECFAGCAALETETLPANVTTISKWAFQNCTSLTAIDIPNTIETIDDNAFTGATSLVSITIDKPENSVSGAPWGATNATITWTG